MIRRYACRLARVTAVFFLFLAPAALAERAQPPALIFAWPDGARATVSETVERKGHTLTFVYRLALHRQANDSYLLDIIDPSLAPGGSLNRSPVASMLLLLFAPPDMKISHDGEWAEAVGMKERIVLLQDTLRAQFQTNGEGERIAALYDQPDLHGMMQDKFTELWGYWVGLWLNAPRRTMETERLLLDSEVLGTPYKYVLSIRNAGFADKDRRYLKLIAESSVADPRKFAKVLRRMKHLGELSAKDLPPLGSVEKVDRRERISAVIEAKTLRPISVDIQREFLITGAGRESRISERRQTRFVWAP